MPWEHKDLQSWSQKPPRHWWHLWFLQHPQSALQMIRRIFCFMIPWKVQLGRTPWFKRQLLKHFLGKACIANFTNRNVCSQYQPQEHTVLRWKVFKMRASCVKHCTSIAAARIIAATIVDKCVHIHSSSKDIPIVHVVHLLDRLTTLLKPLPCMIDMFMNASPRPSSIHYCWSMVSITNPNLPSVIPASVYPSFAELLWFTRCRGFCGSCAKLWCTSRGKYSQLGAEQFKSFFTEYLWLSNKKVKLIDDLDNCPTFLSW